MRKRLVQTGRIGLYVVKSLLRHALEELIFLKVLQCNINLFLPLLTFSCLCDGGDDNDDEFVIHPKSIRK